MIMKTEEQKKALDQSKKIIDKVNVRATNEILEGTKVDGFKISKRILQNIAEWCLNGDTEDEIAHKLELNKNQWAILTTVCPKVLEIMEFGYAYADIVVGGSLLQVAIGGKKIKKQQLVKVGDYENGVKVGEHIEKVEIEEELPPNPILLKYLAENRFTEKFDKKTDRIVNSERNIVDNVLSQEDRKTAENYFKALKVKEDGTN